MGVLATTATTTLTRLRDLAVTAARTVVLCGRRLLALGPYRVRRHRLTKQQRSGQAEIDG